jgi:hypothetical protein
MYMPALTDAIAFPLIMGVGINERFLAYFTGMHNGVFAAENAKKRNISLKKSINLPNILSLLNSINKYAKIIRSFGGVF